MRWAFRQEEVEASPTPPPAEFEAACVDFLERGLRTGQWTYWIADSSREIVGHVFVCRIDKVPKPNRTVDADGYITNVYIRPAYRKQGIGAKLMTRAIAWARQQDFGTLFVWPSLPSVAFYRRAGFEVNQEVLSLELRPYVW